MKTTKTRPPIEIFAILQNYEAQTCKDPQLPKISNAVDKWWERETLGLFETKVFKRDNPCPKCGALFASYKWDGENDIIVRTCACSYKWSELPRDAT